MTFEEIEDYLPNGFHDSAIRGIHVDFVNLFIELKMDLDVSTTDDIGVELYKPGTLKLIRPFLYFLNAPDPTYPFIPSGKAINASGVSVTIGKNPNVDALLKSIPENATKFVFFLDDWNSYLYLAGENAEFFWDDGEPLR